MIRKATFDDIELIEDTYNEHFKHEKKHGAFTVFKKGIYPTRKDAEKAINVGTLYVYEENNGIAGSMIVDKVQPAESNPNSVIRLCSKDFPNSTHIPMGIPMYFMF